MAANNSKFETMYRFMNIEVVSFLFFLDIANLDIFLLGIILIVIIGLLLVLALRIIEYLIHSFRTRITEESKNEK